MLLAVGPSAPPTGLVGTVDSLSWNATGAPRYYLEYTQDDFAHAIPLTTSATGVDVFNLPAGTYAWRVRSEGNDQWALGNDIVSDNDGTDPQVFLSDKDGLGDVFFAKANGVWNPDYLARNVGSLLGWEGTQECVLLEGKNQLNDIFDGSTDANVLLMTDDANGDALFVDDIFSAFPGSIEGQQARLAWMNEVRAGAGDDLVDLTSHRFVYLGNGLTVRGGDGNDTIWANTGSNLLFGDAGNDRLVGASDDDLLAGGAGNDSMHGGGGNDTFAFGEAWGNDTVEQLASGSVLLWFASGNDDNWNAETLTYTDGNHSVTVTGVTADQITRKYGNDHSETFQSLLSQGAFADFSSQKIFEEHNKGVLASV